MERGKKRWPDVSYLKQRGKRTMWVRIRIENQQICDLGKGYGVSWLCQIYIFRQI